MELSSSDGRGRPGSRIAVLSPHLDDGVLSLGAAVHEWSANGAEVSIVTVLAGSPESKLPARPWDSASGFTTAGEASRARRAEDSAACAIVGAHPVWLPYGSAREDRGADDETIWQAIAAAVGDADAVLFPCCPLTHPDHEWLARLVLAHELPAPRIGLYVEQPYAYGMVVGWRLLSVRNLARLGLVALRARRARAQQTPQLPAAAAPAFARPPEWAQAPAGGRSRQAKRRALAEYSSQMSRLGRFLPARIAAYEACWGGEGIAWLDDDMLEDQPGTPGASTLSG